MKTNEISIKDVVTFFKKYPKMKEDLNTEKEVLKGFSEQYNKLLIAFKEKGKVGFMDNYNVSMIVFTNERLINLAIGYFGIDAFFDGREEPYKIPELNYSVKSIKEDNKNNDDEQDKSLTITSKYSGEYLQLVTELCKYGSLQIEIKPDYPMTATLLKDSKEIGLKVIIAPRITND